MLLSSRFSACRQSRNFLKKFSKRISRFVAIMHKVRPQQFQASQLLLSAQHFGPVRLSGIRLDISGRLRKESAVCLLFLTKSSHVSVHVDLQKLENPGSSRKIIANEVFV